MPSLESTAHTRRGRTSVLVLLSVLTFVACAWLLSIRPAKADAYGLNFCTNYYSWPYGHVGDRCASMNYQRLYEATVGRGEHSACVDAMDGAGRLVARWVCTGPRGTYPFASIYFLDQSRWLMGIIRNNTTGARNHISGYQQWFG